MNGIENHVDWTAAAKPNHEQFGPGLSPRKPQSAELQKRNVMDTLLGKNNLAAIDPSGSDPYNATGRFFRR
jgi:hypothetical protein